jgi:hypothetical protein
LPASMRTYAKLILPGAGWSRLESFSENISTLSPSGSASSIQTQEVRSGTFDASCT